MVWLLRAFGGDVMTGLAFDALNSRQRRRLIMEATLRTLATIGVLVTLYYLLPLDRGVDVATVAEYPRSPMPERAGQVTMVVIT
jgi:hypothetical protein